MCLRTRSGGGEAIVGFLLLELVVHFIPPVTERLVTFGRTEADNGDLFRNRGQEIVGPPESEIPGEQCARLY